MYTSDLSDEEWRLIEHHFRSKDNRGATPIHPKRDIVNAILYINKRGARGQMLPKEFPPWKQYTTTTAIGIAAGFGKRRLMS